MTYLAPEVHYNGFVFDCQHMLGWAWCVWLPLIRADGSVLPYGMYRQTRDSLPSRSNIVRAPLWPQGEWSEHLRM